MNARLDRSTPASRGGRGRVVRLLLTAALALATVALGAGPASAHAQLVASTPGSGAVVAQAPARITLEFNERVVARAAETHVFTGTGEEVAVDVDTVDRDVEITPTGQLPEGTVVVAWAVTSADGHEVNGSLTFAVGAPTPGSTANDAFAAPVTTGLSFAHGLTLAAGALAVLGLVALLLLGRAGRWLEACWLVALAAAVLVVPLAAVRDGAGWAGLRDWTHWVDGWLTWRGLLVALAVVAAAGAVSAVRRPNRRPALVAALVLALATPAAFAVPGPAASEATGQPGGSPVAEASASEHTLRMTLDSVVTGTTGFRLEVLDEAGTPVTPYADPRVRATTDGLDLALDLTPDGRGRWRGTVTLPKPGEWKVEVSVRLSEFENPVLVLPFRIGTPATGGGGTH
ncbi:FixH family protein [Nocardioides sp. Root151]|uniref:copper resistance CopC family protein n=1 Tax=Nocardioides sp. Root151 TaxID=1736475 RepID=UPI0009EBF4A4|nr:FixH family protein [Nocardioides sp. Root151]